MTTRERFIEKQEIESQHETYGVKNEVKAHITSKGDIDICDMMRKVGSQVVYLDTDSVYFQYGRTYRGIDRLGLERLDRRVFIYVHEHDDVQVLFYPNGEGWYNLQSRNFRSLKDALNWTERNIK